MLRGLRRPHPEVVHRAEGQTDAQFFAQFNRSTVFGGGRNPMALPAFYRGMHIRTGLISTLPLRAHDRDGRPWDVPVELLDQPDPSETRQTAVARLEASLILRGEYVVVLAEFDTDGFPRSIKVVEPSQATRRDDGSWLIGGRVFGPGEVLHFVPMPLPGETRGISVVELFRRTITGELAATEYQANFYLDGGQPTTALINSDPEATDADIEMMLQRYLDKQSGGRRAPVALPSTIEVRTFPLSNQDAQFLESRQFAATDIANMVGIPGYYIGAPGSSSTYSNIQDQRRDLLDTYLRSSIYGIEAGFSALLPEGLLARFDTGDFLRMDPKSSAETSAVESQWLTVNELRARSGLDPLPGGDVIAATYAPGSTSPAAQEAAHV